MCPDCGTYLIDHEVAMRICYACDYERTLQFEKEVADG